MVLKYGEKLSEMPKDGYLELKFRIDDFSKSDVWPPPPLELR